MKITATLAVAFLGLATFCTAAPPKPMPPQSKSFWPNSWKSGPCDKDKMNHFTCNIMCKCPEGWDGRDDKWYRKARSIPEDSHDAPPTPMPAQSKTVVPNIWKSRWCEKEEMGFWNCNFKCKCPKDYKPYEGGAYRKARSVLEDSSTAAPTVPPPTPVLVSAPPRVIIPFIHTSRPCRPDEKQNWLHCNWICDCADYDYGKPGNTGFTPRLRL
ncbi:hypothetical protein LTR27_011992 [Elasticomyces elasticus]|nr:hypothetical protein LTR27_011992 [Elasticomyces elasticus]